MSRRPARCTQADYDRAVRAVARSGARMAVRVDPEGVLWIVPVENVTADRPPSLRERGIVL